MYHDETHSDIKQAMCLDSNLSITSTGIGTKNPSQDPIDFCIVITMPHMESQIGSIRKRMARKNKCMYLVILNGKLICSTITPVAKVFTPVHSQSLRQSTLLPRVSVLLCTFKMCITIHDLNTILQSFLERNVNLGSSSCLTGHKGHHVPTRLAPLIFFNGSCDFCIV